MYNRFLHPIGFRLTTQGEISFTCPKAYLMTRQNIKSNEHLISSYIALGNVYEWKGDFTIQSVYGTCLIREIIRRSVALL